MLLVLVDLLDKASNKNTRRGVMPKPSMEVKKSEQPKCVVCKEGSRLEGFDCCLFCINSRELWDEVRRLREFISGNQICNGWCADD